VCFVLLFADLPDELPSLTPAPSKKSCFTTSQVHFEHQDTAESLDQHDTHITAVLTRIVVSGDHCTASLIIHMHRVHSFPK